jgi:hypothetical protein
VFYLVKKQKREIEGLEQHNQLLRKKEQKKREKKQALLTVHRPKR